MTTPRVAVAVALLTAACAPAKIAGPHLDAAAKLEAAPYRGHAASLPSGLRVVAYELAGAPSATVSIAYSLAGLPEPEGKEGLRLLVARVMDRNAPGLGGLTMMERHYASGAIWNSDTYTTQLRLDVRCRPDRLPEVLAAESLRMRDPAAGLEDAAIDWLRDGLADEYEDGTSIGEAKASLRLRALQGTPLARRYPSVASVRSLTPEDVRTFLRAALRPERAVVAVIGPLPAPRMVAAAVAAFGEGDPAKPVQAVGATTTPKLDGPFPQALESVKGDGKYPELWLAWAVPGLDSLQSANATAAQRLVELAAQREASGALDRDVRSVDASLEPHEGGSLILLRAVLEKRAKPEEVRGALARAAQAIPEAWARREVYLVNELGMDLTFDTFNRLERGEILNVHEMVRAGQQDALAAWNREAGTMPAQIQGYLRTWIRAERAVAVHVTENEGGEKPDPPGELEQSLPRAASLLGAAAPGASEVTRLVRAPGLAGGERRTLPNGLKVVLLPRNQFPTVQVSLVVAADTETPLAASEKSLVLATTRAWLERCAAPRAVLGAGEVTVSLRGPSARLPQFLERIACWTKADTNRWKVDSALEWLQRLERRPEARAGYVVATLRRTLADPGPARLAPVWAEIDRADAAKRFTRWFRPERATLVVAGKLPDTEAALNDVYDAFAHWAPGGEPIEEPAAPAPTVRRLVVLDYPGAKTGYALAMFRVPPLGARDDAAFRVMQSHLWERLSALAHPSKAEAHLGALDGTHLPYVSVGLSGKREILATAARELLFELDRLAKTPVDAPSLDQARWNASRSAAYAWDDLSPVTASVARLAVRGLPRDSHEKLGAELAAVTAGSLQRYAAAVLGKELVVVAGDAATLVPALKELGLAPEVLQVRDPVKADDKVEDAEP